MKKTYPQRGEGFAEGKAEGLAQGEAKGRKVGRAEGLAEGRNNALLETARKMQAADMDAAVIKQMTGVTL